MRNRLSTTNSVRIDRRCVFRSKANMLCTRIRVEGSSELVIEEGVRLYELSLTRTIARLGKQGGLMVDVGANYGYFSLLWAAQKPGNRVNAFEASPRNQQALRHNVEKNAFAEVVSLRGEAAGKEKGQLSFHLGPEEQTGWGGLVHGDAKGDEVTVPA